MSEPLVLHDAVVFLVVAGLLIPIAQRLRVNPVLSFLMVGLVIGPYGLGRLTGDYPWLQVLLISDVAGVRALAELGVIFLLFMIGLELSPERLWRMRRLVFGFGGAQVLLTGLVIGICSALFGNSTAASVVLGGCLALSSTAIVMQLLLQQHRFGDSAGQGSFAVLLAQDLAVVPILFLVGALAAPAGASVGLSLLMALGQAVLAVAIIVGLGRLVVRPLFRFADRSGAAENFMAITLLAIVGTAAATHGAGLSAALGAFLAGLLLAETEYRHEIEVTVEPFKGLLLGVFFLAVGMGIDLQAIAANPVWIALSVLGLIALKATLITLLARGFGFTWSQAGEVGLLLSQGGEFAFVIVSLALTGGLLPEDTAQFMLVVVSATMFATPGLARLGRWLAERLEPEVQQDNPTDDLPDMEDHVVIVGFGRTGKLLTEMLDRQRQPYLALDMNADRVAAERARGIPIYAGNATRSALLSRLDLPQAAALAICTDDPGATEQILAAARRVAPDIPVVARARDREHAAALLEQGATRVVPELLESGLQFGALTFEELGVPSVAAREWVELERSHQTRGLQPAGAPAGDPERQPERHKESASGEAT